MTPKHNKLFTNLLLDFCKDFDSDQIDNNIPCIFLPHTMPDYHKSEKKIFYIGRDTNRWGYIGELFNDYFSKKKLNEYLPDIADWMKDYGFLEYNNNHAFGFWTLVSKLHLKLKGVNQNTSISSTMGKKYKLLLNDFGWGNINSIEVPQSLQKRNTWKDIDLKKYQYTKNKSKKIDKLKHIIDAYSPDLIFIFNWQADEIEYLEGIEIENVIKFDSINNHLWLYHIKDSKTKIVWSAHPASIKFMKLNIDKMVNSIISIL